MIGRAKQELTIDVLRNYLDTLNRGKEKQGLLKVDSQPTTLNL